MHNSQIPVLFFVYAVLFFVSFFQNLDACYMWIFAIWIASVYIIIVHIKNVIPVQDCILIKIHTVCYCTLQ